MNKQQYCQYCHKRVPQFCNGDCPRARMTATMRAKFKNVKRYSFYCWNCKRSYFKALYNVMVWHRAWYCKWSQDRQGPSLSMIRRAYREARQQARAKGYKLKPDRDLR